MNLRCPICNLEMQTSSMIITQSEVERPDKEYVCINEDCLIKPILPHGWSSPAANAMANCLIQLSEQADATKKKLFTKKREGRLQGLGIAAKMVQVALAAIGYQVDRK